MRSQTNKLEFFHIAVLGKSGSGKSSLLKYMARQDIEADRGFVYFDLHGDAAPFLLRSISRTRTQITLPLER
jgi:DNA helicase HerA-like ATPase